uniref:BZIP domain-containing protein n=2 Tax=Periophthalmus magnuspinnatus TaxID=409849 RepID=A0A3B4AQL8_9GOBI
MNKNDFQELLDKQNLTQEQLELVRDMRRRSKNRQAAQRCRKRKLDCIYNLQCEINKLKTEREKLIQEKSRLCQLRVKTCHSVFTLCQRVCAGADLPPDQLQLLDKNTFAECPLASYAPIIDSLLSSSQPQQSTQLPPSGAAEDVRFFSTESHFSGTKT